MSQTYEYRLIRNEKPINVIKRINHATTMDRYYLACFILCERLDASPKAWYYITVPHDHIFDYHPYDFASVRNCLELLALGCKRYDVFDVLSDWKLDYPMEHMIGDWLHPIKNSMLQLYKEGDKYASE